MHQALCPGTRQWDIVVLVARRGSTTLTEIAKDMGLARTSMQQQVGRLVAEGWLDRTRRLGKAGRPPAVFALSEQSRRFFARQAGCFTRELLDEIADSEGESKLRLLIKGVGRRMIRRLRPRVGQGAPQERAHRLAESLSEQGALSEVSRSPQGLTLTIHTCLYHGLPEQHGVFCDMDRQMVSRLVGAKARTRRRIADGHPCCEFELAVGSGGATKRSQE
jgi:predicted ArsR family transcriptional regulator